MWEYDIDEMSLERVIRFSDKDGYYTSPWRRYINKGLIDSIEKYCPNDGCSILDVGCGSGGYSRYFIKEGANREYLGIDLVKSQKWNYLSNTYSKNGINIKFKEHDATKLNQLGKRFDFIILVTCLEEIEGKPVIMGVDEVLENGGYAFIAVTSKYSSLIYGLKKYRYYSVKSIKSLVCKTSLQNIETVPSGGVFSFVFQLLWSKTAKIIMLFLKVIIYSIFLSQRKARCKLPRLMNVIENLMFLHLKTNLGKKIHKALLITCTKADTIMSFPPLGYIIILQKRK